jgi:hypothetical protein
VPDPTLLTRGNVLAAAIAAAGNNDTDILSGGDSTLAVEVEMTGAAVSDLTVSVQPYESDAATVMPVSMPVVQSVGPTVNAGKVYYYAQFDVTGVDKVRLRITNNNAGGQTINRASWRLA